MAIEAVASKPPDSSGRCIFILLSQAGPNKEVPCYFLGPADFVKKNQRKKPPIPNMMAKPIAENIATGSVKRSTQRSKSTLLCVFHRLECLPIQGDDLHQFLPTYFN